LVAIQENAIEPAEQTAEPKGPLIDLTSTGILEFLETQMNDSAKFHAVPHLLSPSNLEYQLSGRDTALKLAAECMCEISKPISQTTKADRNIPVCAGLGKSRMLEEWQKIFDLAKIQGPRLGALVLYFNGNRLLGLIDIVLDPLARLPLHGDRKQVVQPVGQ